jgi:hypothetical protein
MGVGGQRHAPAAVPPGKARIQEAGWAPGPVGSGAENLAPTGIRSPNRPARTESLYRLRYPGPQILCTNFNLFINTPILIHFRWCKVPEEDPGKVETRRSFDGLCVKI